MRIGIRKDIMFLKINKISFIGVQLWFLSESTNIRVYDGNEVIAWILFDEVDNISITLKGNESYKWERGQYAGYVE